jgi:hypothetical protein
MYIKARCPVCGTDVYHDATVHTLRRRCIVEDTFVYQYTVNKIKITDSQSEDELIHNILQSLQKIIHDGIEIEVLAGILKEDYYITEACCRGFIERIKIELDMYCPDMKKLYFVESN